jgi:hypothetical protein
MIPLEMLTVKLYVASQAPLRVTNRRFQEPSYVGRASAAEASVSKELATMYRENVFMDVLPAILRNVQ